MGLLIIFVWKKLQKKGGNNFKILAHCELETYLDL